MALPRRGPLADLFVLPIVLVAGAALWWMHAHALDLGGRTPILDDGTAPYALAARELEHGGRLATTFALPVELASHADPPWPLASLQPGLVLIEAALFRLAPGADAMGRADDRAWLTLILPFVCFLMLGASLALATRHLLARFRPEAPASLRIGAALVLALSFVLDPESQHFACGGFSELPYTLGLLFACLGIALGAAAERPFLYGLGLGATGLFGASVPGFALALAAAGALSAPRSRRTRAFVLALAGAALPIAPWWLHEWRALGPHRWAMTRLALWDGIDGRSAFSLGHLAVLPDPPAGFRAVSLFGAKVLHNVPALLASMTLGPRGLWLGALVGWLALARAPGPLAAAAFAGLACDALGVLGAAAGIPWPRDLYPVRVLLEPMGVLALGALILRLPGASVPPALRRALLAGVAALALGWGGWSCVQGLARTRATSFERGVPATPTLRALSGELARRLAPGETVMSNLGPVLAWSCGHPVLDLALSPDDVAACRRRLGFRNVVLVFRDPQAAWGEWREVMATPGEARTLPHLDVANERRGRSADGFEVVWLELGPLEPGYAAATPAGRRLPPGAGNAAPRAQRGMTSEPGSSPSSCAGYSAGSSRRLSTNSGTSPLRRSSASGPSPTLITL